MREIHSIEEFKKEILERDGLSLVDFKTDWCRHCKLMQPLVDAKEAETGNHIFFCYCRYRKGKGLIRYISTYRNAYLHCIQKW